MVEETLEKETIPERFRRFTQRVLEDLAKLEKLLAAGSIESHTRRVGAEQERVVVDRNWDPNDRYPLTWWR